MLTIDLQGRTTLVIGGSRGIGACVVRTAAEAGSDVAWTYPNVEKEIAASTALAAAVGRSGIRVHHAVTDATDRDATVSLVEAVLSRFGRIDHLVYCAGFTSPVPLLDLTAEAWRRNVDLNLTGAFINTHAVLPAMISGGGGSIVLVGSAAVATGGGGRADYISAKAGLEGLNRAVTREFAPKRIRCNVVHPSLIETELLTTRYPDPARRRTAAEGVPLRRLGQPEDVANAVVFLLSDRASYITGQSLFVDGGRTFCG